MRRQLFITWVVLLVAQACILIPDIVAAQGPEAVKACEQVCYAESRACVKALCLPGGALRPPYDKGPDGNKRYGTCYSGCRYAHSVSSNPCESLCVRMTDVPRCMNPVLQTALSCWRDCRGAWTEYGACDKRCRQVAADALATRRQSAAGATPEIKPVKPDVAVSGRMGEATPWTTLNKGFPAGAEVEILIEASPTLPGYVVIDEAPFATFQPRAGRLDQQGRFIFRFTAPQDPDEYVIRFGINFGDEVGYHDDAISVQIAEPKIVLLGNNAKWRPIEGKGDPAARSHRYNLDLRSAEALFLYGSRARQLADDLLSYSWGRAIVRAYAEDNVQQILKGGGWQPSQDPHAQAVKYGKLFADYWKWGVDFNVKFTGNILAEWPISETVEQTFEITGDVMKYTGVDVSTFKVGDILDKVGFGRSRCRTAAGAARRGNLPGARGRH